MSEILSSMMLDLLKFKSYGLTKNGIAKRNYQRLSIFNRKF